MILATSAVHSWLTQRGLRTLLFAQRALGRVHRPALLRGARGLRGDDGERLSGAGQHRRPASRAGLIEGTLTEAMARYRNAIDQGLLKIMSKMGISVISSYRGGLNFEAVGLSRAMVAEYFPGMLSRISGIGVSGPAEKRPRRCMPRASSAGGGGGAAHRRFLQGAPLGRKARLGGDDDAHDAAGLQPRPPTRCGSSIPTRCGAIRRSTCAICWTSSRWAIRWPIEEVESITSIRKRFVTPGMSLGALSPEAHKTLNVAMNRIGAKSDSGEGGEDPAAFRARAEWRQPQRQDQAGGLGAVRRDRRVPEPLRRAGNQGGARGQARRRRPAARHEGHRPDRAAAAFDQGRDADSRRRRITISTVSRIWRS